VKQFFIRLHFLVTNPNAFVLSYSTESARKVLQFFLFTMVVMTAVTAGVRTVTVAKKLPSQLSSMLPEITITQGKLASPQGIVVPEPWKIADLNNLLNGRTTPAEMIPDSMIVIDPTGKTFAPILFSADSVHFMGKIDSTGKRSYSFVASWSELTRIYDLDFSESEITTWVDKNKFSLFMSLTITSVMQIVGDLLNLWILLFLVILLYRRDLVLFWTKKSTIKIILNGTIPYFILMPLFAVAGDRAELLVTASAVIATIIIARSFRHHRITLFSANAKDNKE